MQHAAMINLHAQQPVSNLMLLIVKCDCAGNIGLLELWKSLICLLVHEGKFVRCVWINGSYDTLWKNQQNCCKDCMKAQHAMQTERKTKAVLQTTHSVSILQCSTLTVWCTNLDGVELSQIAYCLYVFTGSDDIFKTPLPPFLLLFYRELQTDGGRLSPILDSYK